MELSLKKRWEIIFLLQHKQGPKLSYKQTSKVVKVSIHTVKHWLKVYQETGDVLDCPCVGRPRSTTAKTDSQIVQMVEINDTMTSIAISAKLKGRMWK